MSLRSRVWPHASLNVRAVDELGRRLLTAWQYRSEHVQTSAGAVHLWRVAGSGPLPPLLLIHGFGSAAMHWIPMIEHLRPHVRAVWAVDLLGHGFSARPATLTADQLRVSLFEALDQVALDRAVVVGNSLGGIVALRYVNARPERAAGLLLLSPAGAPLDAEELARLQRLFTVETYLDAVRFMDNLVARPSRVRSRLAAAWVRGVLADPVLRSWLHSVAPHEEGDPDGIYLTPEEVRSVPVPFEVVWGAHDRVLPASTREFWRANAPGALVEPEHVGHTPYLDDRQWTADHIRQFAARVTSGASSHT